MLINVIHCSARVDRRQTLNQQIIAHDLDVRIWEAQMNPMMPFQGISVSHKMIVMDAQQKGLQSVCIAEDDFYFMAPGAWDYFLENMPEDFDIYLSSISMGHIKPDKTVHQFCGLTLYIVHERFYDKFLSVPETLHIDAALGGMGKFVVSDPFIAFQYNGYSDQKQMYTENDNHLIGRNLFGR